VISATEFRAKCLKILDELKSQGIVITPKGQPVAKLTPLHVVDNSKLIGSMKGKVIIKGDIFSTGRKWNAQS
jgi:antitoxin (DNA-binding transcriptional repressor) of toxin-antitoxin stability system